MIDVKIGQIWEFTINRNFNGLKSTKVKINNIYGNISNCIIISTNDDEYNKFVGSTEEFVGINKKDNWRLVQDVNLGECCISCQKYYKEAENNFKYSVDTPHKEYDCFLCWSCKIKSLM